MLNNVRAQQSEDTAIWPGQSSHILRNLLLRPITVDCHCGKRPVAAGSHEVEWNKKTVREIESLQQRWNKVSASVFSANNQPSLPASIFILNQICFQCLVHLSLMEKEATDVRACTCTHTHTDTHAHQKKFSVHRSGNLPVALHEWSNGYNNITPPQTDNTINSMFCSHNHERSLKTL